MRLAEFKTKLGSKIAVPPNIMCIAHSEEHGTVAFIDTIPDGVGTFWTVDCTYEEIVTEINAAMAETRANEYHRMMADQWDEDSI